MKKPIHTVTHRALAERIGKLLSDDRATHPDFMIWVSEELERNGYKIEAHQRGIQGTYLCITKDE